MLRRRPLSRHVSTIAFWASFAGATLATAVSMAAEPASAGAGKTDARVVGVEFTDTPAPATPIDMVVPLTTSSAVVTYADGSRKSFPLDYRILYRSGNFVGGWYAGLIVDHNGKPLLSVSTGPDSVAQGPFFAYGPDANSLIAAPGSLAAPAPAAGKPDGEAGGEPGANPLMLVTHFEYHTEAPNEDPARPELEMYRRLPMVMNLSLIDQDPDSGALEARKIVNVDFAATHGLWTPCAGSLSPWGTHLGSEEYEPDARTYETVPLEPMNAYLGTLGKLPQDGGANPYNYGHIVEVTAHPDGSSQPVKHYGMGRLAFELADVMPDARTAYVGDDGDDVVRIMFVADKANDLSAGTLYAAQWVQQGDDPFGAASLRWIRLGHASDAEIEAVIKSGILFSDIFDAVSADAYRAEPAKYGGHRPVFVDTGTGGGDAKLEYLKLKPGREKAAAFLETRRYAGYLGATTEFTKMEGQTHNAADKTLYTVISYARPPMVEGTNGERPRDDIRLSAAKADLVCGVVYASSMGGGASDTDGAAIASDWVARDMRALVHGRAKPKDQKVGPYDKCDTDMVANPDNIKFSEAMRTLFIGEDSGNHLNNFTWAYNVDTERLSRIFSAPIGAENTGLQAVDDINGHAYIMTNVQHPGAAGDLKKYPPEVRDDMRRMVDPRGAIGYLGGLPAIDR